MPQKEAGTSSGRSVQRSKLSVLTHRPRTRCRRCRHPPPGAIASAPAPAAPRVRPDLNYRPRRSPPLPPPPPTPQQARRRQRIQQEPRVEAVHEDGGAVNRPGTSSSSELIDAAAAPSSWECAWDVSQGGVIQAVQRASLHGHRCPSSTEPGRRGRFSDARMPSRVSDPQAACCRAHMPLACA